jgi:hypothetical protein
MGDDNTDYVNFLDAILTEKKLTMASGIDDGQITAATGQIGTNPVQWGDDVFYDAEEQFDLLMNLMSKKNQASYLY